MNELLNKKITGIANSLDFGESKKVTLKGADLLRVSRWVSNGLDDRDYSIMTVTEARKYGAWDACNGTMSYSITIADELDDNMTINGCDVLNGRYGAYVVLDGFLPED